MMKRNILIVLGLLLLFGLPLSVVVLQRSQNYTNQAATTELQASKHPFGKAAKLAEEKSALVADALLPGSVFTFEAWVQVEPFTETTQETRTIFSQARKNASNSMNLAVVGSNAANNGESGTLMLTMQQGGKVVSIPATAKLTTNTWHHLAVVKTPDRIKVMLDGFFVADKSYTGSLQFDARDILSFGATVVDAGEVPTNQLRGTIDDIRLSNIVRYEKDGVVPTAPFVADAQTLALWHLDGTTEDSGLQVEGLQFIGSIEFIDSLIGVAALPTPTVVLPPSVLFMSPEKENTPYTPVIPVVLEVTGMTVEEIEVLVDGKTLCTLSSQPYVCNWTVGPAGINHVLEARVRDNTGKIVSETISVMPQ